MTTRRKKHLLLLSAVALLAALAVAALWTGLAVRIYTVPTYKLTAPVRLVLLTDLHSTIHGEDQEKLVELIGEQDPDALLMAGDMADDEVPHRSCCWRRWGRRIPASMSPATTSFGRRTRRRSWICSGPMASPSYRGRGRR